MRLMIATHRHHARTRCRKFVVGDEASMKSVWTSCDSTLKYLAF